MDLLNTIPGFIEIESTFEGEMIGKEWINVNLIKCFGPISGGSHITMLDDNSAEDCVYTTPYSVDVIAASIRQAQMRTSNPSFI